VAGAATIAGYDNPRKNTLLATAKVSLQGPNGQLQTGGWQICYLLRICHRLKKYQQQLDNTLGLETQIEVFIIPTVITEQPSVSNDTDLNIPEGLPLTDPDFR